MSRGEGIFEDSTPVDLRDRAESLSERSARLDAQSLPPDEMIRELQLHRMELERQNIELRHYLEKLEATRERYADLYFNAPVGYVTLDHEAKITDLNFLAAELLGQNRKALLHYSLLDRVSSSSRQALSQHLKKLYSSTGVHQCYLTVDLGTDARVHLKMLSIAVDDSETGELHCRSALFDVTEDYKAQQDRHDLEEQLRQSHRMEALGRLTSGIAHDFNNLLTLIIGYSKLAINQLPEDSPFLRHAVQINKAGHHASDLIEQLLAFSRSQTVSANPLEINESIADMENMFDRLVGDDIELHLRLDGELGIVHFDSSQFQQVLMNLVVNAREAMPSGGDLIIRTRNVVIDECKSENLEICPGPYVLIEVEDTGAGIPADVLPSIFDPYFSTKSNRKSHGFGLSTTQDIVLQHHGAIDVSSEPHRGTTFSVYLPRTDIGPDSSETIAEPCVLVVDDQPDLRDFASLVLEEMSVSVLSARSPDDALQQARTHGTSIDLVVTDVIMPGMSGPELIEQLRTWHPNALALYISGHDHHTLCNDRGIDPEAPFLEKPFSPEHLLEMVEELLQQKPE